MKKFLKGYCLVLCISVFIVSTAFLFEEDVLSDPPQICASIFLDLLMFLCIYKLLRKKPRSPDSANVPSTTNIASSVPQKTISSSTFECPFFIQPSVYPPPEGYNILNTQEQLFFRELERQLVAAKINPQSISLTRLSSGTFNIQHTTSYVGKINLCPKVVPDKYVVWKNTRQRPLRVFTSLEEAEQYKDANKGDRIEFRKGSTAPYQMQYLQGLYTIENINTTNFDDCVNAIPFWIKYIKYTIRLRRQALAP